jgi:predicted enzyme related to lactoylglutathione lyase
MADYRGRFLWYELLTTDPKGAQGFYAEVTGWGTEPWAGSPMPYTLWKRGNVAIGGVMELPAEARQAGAPPHWLPYIGAPDIDGTVAQATKAGAKTSMGPEEVPSVGRVAVLQDPQGAVFGLYRPNQEPAAVAPPQLGDCTWHELAAADENEAWRFYSALFGWEKHGQGHDMGPMGIYQEYGCPGMPFPLGGVYRKPAEMPAPPHFMLYFRVTDVRRSAELVKSLGGQVLNGPMEVPGGDFIVNCLDPQGAAFSLHHTEKAY